jgi:methionyl aminopeptidase
MTINTEADFEGMRAAGRVVADTLRAMRGSVRVGVSTGELDRIAADVFARAGARSAPRLDYGFPGHTCISINDEAVHGIPGPRPLRDGDLVKLDVTAEQRGYYADACVTVTAGRARAADRQFIATARLALNAGLEQARAGAPLNAIGAAVERTVIAGGQTVCRSLTGHGIGRRIHEDPSVPNHYNRRLDQPLTDGLVITVEPIISAGTGAVHASSDGWTVCTDDGARSGHMEHTLVIRNGTPLLLTA